ncbi:MAG TPA: pyridoxal-phosphate dependent enzyme, partial [Saprospiraceae bacterium]|nr:pyridoxal-phosphate dependent enzyme [Saprospiraceae bacterium]
GHSIKDRMAVKMIDDAEASGKLSPGGTIIECTSGNTGMGLALVACVRGYKCIFTTSDKQSKEKIDMLKAMGAEVIVCPTNVEPTDPRSYYSVAEKLSKEINNSFWCNQYDNLSNGQAHYESTGPEIWDQTDGKITHLVVGVGTGGTISGTARFLKEKNPAIRIWGIDTYGSVFKKYHETGIFDEKEIYPYITEGIGEDILPKNVDFSLIDLFEKVSDKDAALAARRLAREEGILLGYSAGSALAGLHQLKNQLKPEDTVVLIFHDHGSRYVGKIYNDDWMRQRGFLESELKVRDLVAAKKDKSFYSVSPDSRLRDVLTMIKDHDISQLPVMKDEEVIGTISENSILQYILENPLKNADKAVSEIMSEPMPRVSMDLPLGMLNKCFTEKIPGVITRDQSNQYHVLTKYDIIRAL